MALIKYELKKIFSSRIICTIVLLLIAANVFTCSLFAQTNTYSNIPTEDIIAFFYKYNEDTETIEKDYLEYTAQKKQQESLLLEAINNGIYDYEPPPPPDKYAKEGYSDGDLYNILYEAVDYFNNYPHNIEKIINRSRTKIIEYNLQKIPSDTYVYKYQNTIISTYKYLPDYINLNFEYIRGWDTFFNYNAVNVFTFLALIVICSVVFTQEKNCGILPILRVSKNGKAKTAFAKLVSVFIITTLVVLLFTLSSFLTVYSISGYSSTGNAIQAIKDFTFCPYIYTIGEFFIILVLQRLLTFCLFSCTVVFLSLIFNSYTLNFAVSLAFLGINILLNNINYSSSNNLFKNLNLVNTSNLTAFYKDYPALNIFENVVHYIPFLTFVFSIICIFLFFISVIIYAKTPSLFSVKIKLPKYKRFFSLSISLRQRKKRKLPSVFASELYKTFISSRLIWLVLLLFVFKVFIAYNTFQAPSYYSDGAYKEYMLQLTGEMTDEKRQFLNDEGSYINNIIEKYSEMNDGYFKGTVSEEEYISYMSEYKYANLHTVAFKRVNMQAQYIDKMGTKGENAWFVYDTGWLTMLLPTFDPTLYAAILLLFSQVFPTEFNKKSSDGSFASILRTTKYGRSKTFWAKVLSSFFSAFSIALLWTLTDMFLILNTNLLCAASAPLRSIQAFEYLPFNISILHYTVLLIFIKCLAFAIFGAICCLLSANLKKIIPTLTAAVILTLAPSLLASFGLKEFSNFDFVSLTKVSVFLLNINRNTAFIIILTIGSALLLLRAEKEWNK